MNRNLDGIYFRVERDGKFENICFSDMTENEIEIILKDADTTFLKGMCKLLAKTLKNIGDEFDIVCE